MVKPTPQLIRFTLHISSQEYLAYYQGVARQVWVRANDGRSLQFPAALLRPYVSHSGIHGEFEMEVDANNKCLALKRITSS